MSRDDYRIYLFLLVIYVKHVFSCGDIDWLDPRIGHVQSENFFFGQSHPKNVSCRWKINSNHSSDWIISLRILDVQFDSNSWTNELIIRSDRGDLFVDDFNQRTYHFSSISHLEIDFPIKSPSSFSPTLNIHRFYMEIYRVNNYTDGFHCQKSDLIIPQQWRCNCQYECGSFDGSDEIDCPLCDILPLANSLLCHSNETWCLQNGNPSSGSCVPSTWSLVCAYETKCQTVVAYLQNQGEILVRDSLLSHHQSLCFVVISKENFPIKLIVNRHDFLNPHFNWTYSIHDGDRNGNRLLSTSNVFTRKKIFQTQRNHLATIVIEKSSKDSSVDSNELLLNITWSTVFCPEDEFLCSGHYETKCFTKQQRCDGKIMLLIAFQFLFVHFRDLELYQW